MTPTDPGYGIWKLGLYGIWDLIDVKDLIGNLVSNLTKFSVYRLLAYIVNNLAYIGCLRQQYALFYINIHKTLRILCSI